MLNNIVEYAGKIGLISEPGFTAKQVKWAIFFDSGGDPVEVLELGDTQAKRNRGRLFPACPALSQPELVKGPEARCHFLVESAEVIALYMKENAQDKDIKKCQAKHDFFVRLLEEASSAIPQLAAISSALKDADKLEKIRAMLQDKKAKNTDAATIASIELLPPIMIERDEWRDWWRNWRAALGKGEGKKPTTDKMMRCFITGELVEPARTLPKIKGLADVDGMPTGDVMSGFDKEAFRSFGLQQSTNAAVSEETAVAYVGALEHLIRETGRKLAGAKVVHWFKERVEPKDDPLTFLERTEETEELDARQKAREMLDAIRQGKRPDLGENYFYAITMSGAAGRVMVRDWMEGQFETLLKNINKWFDDLAIVQRDGMRIATPPKFMAVLGSTVRELKNLNAPFVAKMWRTAVKKEQIPAAALAAALTRARVDILDDQPFNHARMGLMRAYHVRKGDCNMKPQLNEDHPSPAYHCGRLMAVLARVQYSALGDVGAGIVQRYYAAASSTPALVLGRLVRTCQFHLNKLQPGQAWWYNNKISSIFSGIKDSIPATLTLEEQSLFALGYYHQMAAERAGKPEEMETGDEKEKEVSGPD